MKVYVSFDVGDNTENEADANESIRTIRKTVEFSMADFSERAIDEAFEDFKAAVRRSYF